MNPHHPSMLARHIDVLRKVFSIDTTTEAPLKKRWIGEEKWLTFEALIHTEDHRQCQVPYLFISLPQIQPDWTLELQFLRRTMATPDADKYMQHFEFDFRANVSIFVHSVDDLYRRQSPSSSNLHQPPSSSRTSPASINNLTTDCLRRW
ncbi:unnamed protein product [Lactuca virosa]|uniref:Uncharacterized protein n=1 Tax=Lactuca virosa TaxID=75947 RepID=A0AAU9PUQ9_9ASTR|nr:unnamed protein product [Lactuca virosa]